MSILKYFSRLEPKLEPPNLQKDKVNQPQVNQPKVNQLDLDIPKIRQTFTVWTDGACSSNGKRNATGGIGVFFHDDSPLNISEPMMPKKGKVTNNICELEAVRRAILNIVNQEDYDWEDDILVYTDSQYLINSVTKWSNTWAANGWIRKNSKGKKVPVKNKELIQAIKGLCTKHNVILSHCKAHTNFTGAIGSREYVIWYGNKRADELAVAGANNN